MQPSAGDGRGEKVFSVVLVSDGALTWDVPPPVEEDGVVVPGGEGPKPVNYNAALEGFRGALGEASQEHLMQFVKQLLSGLQVENTEEWLPVIVDLAQNAAQCLEPSTGSSTGIPDPRNFIKVESVPYVGGPQDSKVIHGVVLRKNRAHRRMQSNWKNPRLLLLAGALEFESTATTLLQLNSTYTSKGKEYLEFAISKICSYQPSVVLVEKNVARGVVEKLNEEGITLVYNVPLERMERLAICTGTVIVKSVSEIQQNCIGHCEEFKVVDVIRRPSMVEGRSKRCVLPPLMVFEGCKFPRMCTIVLYGDTTHQLEAVGKVVSSAVFASYHMRLESAFLADELSVASTATAAVAQGFPEDAGTAVWNSIADCFVGKSASSVSKWRAKRFIHSMSPHISGWWAEEARQHIMQSKDYVTPVFSSAESSSALEADEEDRQRNEPENGTGESSGDHFLSAPSFSEPPSVRNGLRCDSERWDESIASGTVGTIPKNASAEEDWELCTKSIDEELRSGDQTVGPEVPSVSGRIVKPELQILEQQDFTSSIAIRNHRRGLMCIPHHLHTINYYDQTTDISLAGFLMSIAADSDQRCEKNCHGGNSSHVRTYLHGGMRITMSVVSLPAEKELEGPALWFWARPKGLGNEPLTSVRRIQLSSDGMAMSFGEFLDLSCNSRFLQVFDRQLHLEFVRYFGYGRTVACVYQDRFQPYEILIPPRQLQYNNDRQLLWVNESVNELLQEANEAYDAVEIALNLSQQHTSDGPASRDCFVQKSLVRDIHQEHTEFTDKLKHITRHAKKGRLDASSVVKFDEMLLNCALELNGLRRHLTVNILTWAAMLSDPSTYEPMTLQSTDEDVGMDSETVNKEIGLGPKLQCSLPVQDSAYLEGEMGKSGVIGTECIVEAREEEECSDASTSTSLQQSHQLGSGSLSDMIQSDASDTEVDESEWRPRFSPFAALIDRAFSPIGTLAAIQGEDAEGSIEEGVPLQPQHPVPDMELQTLATMEPVEKCLRKILHRNSSASNLIDVFNHTVETLEDTAENDAPTLEDGDHQGEGGSHRRCSSDPFSSREEPLVEQLSRRLISRFSGVQMVEDGWRDSFKTQNSEQCSDTGQQGSDNSSTSNSQTLPAPLRLPKQLSKVIDPGTVRLTDCGQVTLKGRSLILPGSDDVVIPVFDDEPGSVIAHMLASITYQKKLQQEVDSMQLRHVLEAEETKTMQECSSSGDIQQQGSVGDRPFLSHQHSTCDTPWSLADVPISDSLYKHQAHIPYRFEDDGLKMMPWSQAKFEVVSFYAPQFAKLRSRCLPGGEKSFIMSLSRCKPWKARGGKTNAYFCKTMDERYIIKAMSTKERDSFLRHFGPHYLKYVDEAASANRDLCLAKILGVFQVSMKSRTEEWDRTLLIMENVFYDCHMVRKYDLKGSRRSRFNSEAENNTKCEETVFLDNNLRKHNLQAPPLLVDQSNLDRLVKALKRDSQFLCDLYIMDYSLILGLDKERMQLVVGIIDFVREYTFDKKIESLIKSSGIMGEAGAEPTIVSPNAYRIRFVNEIWKYFTVVPTHDDWDLPKRTQPPDGLLGSEAVSG